MLIIDEAIAHARDVANEQKRRSGICIQNDSECDKFSDCLKCAEEHEQLAEWLEELKDYRDKNKMVVRVDVENMDSIKYKIDELSKYAEIQYEKAIDDFVNFANTMPTVEAEDGEVRPMWLEEMAEQLKAGGKNE